MVSKAKLMYEQVYHALLGGVIGNNNTYPFREICSTIGLTKKEWNKVKVELSFTETQIEQIENYLKEKI